MVGRFGRQGMRPKRQAPRRTDPQETSCATYALYETAWASAWPHLDDWFTDDWFKDRGASQPARKDVTDI